jgi:LacI family transcriptional regulator
MAGGATIYDVADLAGVSPATVSRVLKRSCLIGEEARGKVLRAARKVGYAPKRVRRQRDRSILNIKLILPRHESGLKRLFYDFSELVDGLREGLAPCEMNLMTEVARRGFDPFPHKKGGDIDAFVFAFQRPAERVVREIRERGASLVVLNRALRGVPHVSCDNRDGMRQLARHLAERGVSGGVLFLGYQGIEDVVAERLAGFAEGAGECGIRFDPDRQVICFRSPEEVGRSEIERVLREKITTIVCVNDVLAAVVLQKLQALGVAVPGEVKITGFDDSPVRSLLCPELTTVSMPVAGLAREAGKQLQAVLVDQEDFPASVRLGGRLLPGETT